MHTIYVDSNVIDELRRKRLYEGELFVFSPRPSSIAFCEFVREMIKEAFHPQDPTEAQFRLSVEKFVEIAAPVKPRFIHHPESKTFIRRILEDMGCDMSKTYFDVPRMRIVTHGDYLKAGVAYPLHPHRDTWYSQPFCQLNWWLPIFDFESESSMAFFPQYWSRGVRNSSSSFNYYEWNATGRKDSAKHIASDTRKQPRAEEPLELEPQIRIVCPVGGIILFSAAQLHATVPNTSGRTRFSIDFRTAHLDDLVAKRGAPNADSAPTGTSLRDLMRGTDLSRLSEEVVALYEDAPPTSGVLVFQPEGVATN
ncbi:MAG: hypothetical protein ACREJ6_03975 [Candidatus Methylomirabilis sp.]